MSVTPRYIQLSSDCPRRFFIPLTLVDRKGLDVPETDDIDTSERASHLKALRAKLGDESYDVYLNITKGKWKRVDGHRSATSLPREQWTSCVYPPRATKQSGGSKGTDPSTFLDLAFAVGDAYDSAGLYVTWTPSEMDSSSTPCLLICNNRSDIEFPTQQSVNADAALILEIGDIAIGLGEEKKTKKPPGLTWLYRLRNPHRPYWAFRVAHPLVVLGLQDTPPDAKADHFTLCLDFGSCATSAQIVTSSARLHGARRLTDEGLGAMLSWESATCFPDFDSAENDRLRDVPYYEFSVDSQTRPPDGFNAVPREVRAVRQPLLRHDERSVPSLMYSLEKRDTRCAVLSDEEVIGFEAKAIHDAESIPIKHDCMVYSPKMLLGSSGDDGVLRWKDQSKRKQEPAYYYLKEFFDQLCFLKSADYAGSTPSSHIDTVVMSFPVAWPEDRVDQFRTIVERGITDSYLSSLFTDHDPSNAILKGARYSMDEASAAFLGFVYTRYGLIQKQMRNALILLHKPYVLVPNAADNASEVTSKDPDSLHVLVFDSGESTTDLVLLELTAGSLTSDPVKSRVLHHFAIEQAGLEITRQVARHVKRCLSEHLSDDEHKEDDLKTYLREPGIEDKFRPRKDQDARALSVYEYRKRLISRLYTVAEELKIQASTNGSGQFDYSRFSPLLDVKSGQGTVSRDQIASLARTVYAAAFRQIGLWVKGLERVDLVLLSGRSSQLPGLVEGIKEVIPVDKRPLNMDFVTCESVTLDGIHELAPDIGKSIVCMGLASNNIAARVPAGGQRMDTEAIAPNRRNRAIGLLDLDESGFVEQAYDTKEKLLIEADNLTIDDTNRHVTFSVENPDLESFYLGINFAGKTTDGDKPRAFSKVTIETPAGKEELYHKKTFGFYQESATQLYLESVTLFNAPDTTDPLVGKVKDGKPGPYATIELDGLTVKSEPYYEVDDFRVTGLVGDEYEW